MLLLDLRSMGYSQKEKEIQSLDTIMKIQKHQFSAQIHLKWLEFH